MIISSSAFDHNGDIPSKYTCQGENVNPPLSFEGVPEKAQSLALIVDDPDAAGKTWIHWVLFNIPANVKGIDEASIPSSAEQGVTDFGHPGYGGPCPPSGKHRYFFKLYALDVPLKIAGDVTTGVLANAMAGHILDQAELIGLFAKQ